MTEYISREEALNFELEVEADPEDIKAITKGMALYAEYIKSIPAADVVERKKGEWARKYHKRNGIHYLGEKCSVCGYEVMVIGYDFCPNCGASMKGE